MAHFENKAHTSSANLSLPGSHRGSAIDSAGFPGLVPVDGDGGHPAIYAAEASHGLGTLLASLAGWQPVAPFAGDPAGNPGGSDPGGLHSHSPGILAGEVQDGRTFPISLYHRQPGSADCGDCAPADHLARSGDFLQSIDLCPDRLLSRYWSTRLLACAQFRRICKI